MPNSVSLLSTESLICVSFGTTRSATQCESTLGRGGSQLAQSLIEQKLVDEIILYLAPKLMGSDGRGLFGALGFDGNG